MRLVRPTVGRLLLAIVVAANLMHAPSLVLANGPNAGADCAVMMTEAHGHHSGAVGTGDTRDTADHPKPASMCPFASASPPLVAVPASAPLPLSFSRLGPDIEVKLRAADLDAEDPPPRVLA